MEDKPEVKNLEMAKSFKDNNWSGGWGRPSSDWGRPWTPDPTWIPKIRLTNEDIPRPCTSSITENVAEDVRTVQVPVHQVTDRKIMTVGRKQRKRKDYQTECKAS